MFLVLRASIFQGETIKAIILIVHHKTDRGSSVSPRMNAIASRDQFKLITIEENVLVNDNEL